MRRFFSIIITIWMAHTAGFLFPLPVWADINTAGRYYEAMVRFHRGEVHGALALWRSLLANEQGELSPAQVAAIKGFIEESETKLHVLATTAEQVSLDRALAEYRQAAPLLKEPLSRDEAQERLAIALFFLRQAGSHQRQDHRYDYLMGACLLYLSRSTDAKPYIERAVAKKPNDVESLNLLAEYLRITGQRDRCIEVLERSYAIDSGQARVALYLARLLLARSAVGDETRAIELARSFPEDSPERLTELAMQIDEPPLRNALESRAAELRIARARADLDDNYRTLPYGAGSLGSAGADDGWQDLADGARGYGSGGQARGSGAGGGAGGGAAGRSGTARRAGDATSRGRVAGDGGQSSTQSYPGPPGVTKDYSGRYRVMGRNEFYIIRAPAWRKYRRLEAIRRSRNRPRLWPRPLGDTPY